jgi:hypothetical protein
MSSSLDEDFDPNQRRSNYQDRLPYQDIYPDLNKERDMYRSQSQSQNNNNLDSFFPSNRSSTSSFPYFGSQSNFQQPYIPQPYVPQQNFPQQNFPQPFRKEFNLREYQPNYDRNSKDKIEKIQGNQLNQNEQLQQIEKLESELKTLRRNKAIEIQQIQGNNNIDELKNRYIKDYSKFTKEKEDLIKSLGDINKYLQRIIVENNLTDSLLDDAIKEQNNTSQLIGELEKLIHTK